MFKKLVSIFLCFALVNYVIAPITTNAVEPKKNSDKIKTIQKLKNLSNGKLKLSENEGKVFVSGKLSTKQVVGEKSATKFLQDNKSLFGIESATSDLKTIGTTKDSIGDTYVKYAQVINGIKINNSMLNVHFDKSGVIASVNGKVQQNKSITTIGTKTISESEAVEIAKKQYTFKKLRNVPETEKLILIKDNKNYEVFKVNISFTDPKIANYDVFVEVSSGKVIQTENNIRTDGATTGSGIDVQGNVKSLNLYQSGTSYQMKDNTKASSGIDTYSLNHGTSSGNLVTNNTNSFTTEDDKADVSAHYNAGKVIDFYKNLFSRNSLDNNGMVINSYTHYGYDYNNAYWDGYEMVYGDGDGNEFTYLSGDLDVVGHEMTHGVISKTANLAYHNQSGALNESLADTFGVLISSYNKYNVSSGQSWTFNAADWVIGADIYTPNIPGDALRSLSNPTLYDQPDNMSNYQNSSDDQYGDYGGVHTNSGIPNKAAYLTAKSLGMEKTAKIYYKALVNYMNPDTDFEDEKNCLEQSATDLYGANSVEATVINNSFSSVGVGSTQSSVTGVSLDKTEASLKVGGATTLVATVNPSDSTNKNVMWSSSDSSVATVDDAGNVTATGIGTAAITVTTLDGGYTASCDVTVLQDNPNDPYEPNDTIQTAYPINFGTTYQSYISTSADVDYYKLNISNTQNLNISLSNLPDDYDIALYDSDGNMLDQSSQSGTTSETINLNSIGAGDYYLKVYSYSGYSTNQKYSLIASTDSTTSVTGVSLDKTTASLKVGETTMLVATINPTSASNKNVTWSSSNSSVATVNNAGNVTAVGAGNATIKVTTSDGGLTASCGITVNNLTVTFNSQGGSVVASKNALYNSAITAPISPTRTGYTFGGWYKEAGCINGWNFATNKVTTSTILYAKWAVIAPGIPNNFKAVSSSYNSINTSWNIVNGANGYEVYRSTSSKGAYHLASTTTARNFNNTGLTTNTNYYYEVRAYRLIGSIKVYSNCSSVITAKPVLAVPTSVKAVSSSYNSINTSWSAVNGANGYEVYRSTSSKGAYHLASTTTARNFNNTGLTTNSNYYYKVRAYRMVGKVKAYSYLSSIVIAKPLPVAPSNVKAVRTSSKSIKLTWKAATGTSGYEVFKATSSGGKYSLVSRISSLYYTNSGLVKGRTYYYKIRSYRNVGKTRVYSNNWSGIVHAKTY